MKELRDTLSLSNRIKKKIMDECKVSRATLSNWNNKKTPIPHWAKEKINVIVKEELGYIIFEGETT